MVRESSAGVANCCELEGLGIESRWGDTFHNLPDRPWGPPRLLYSDYRVFIGDKAVGWEGGDLD